jgi:hypothetical protein
MASMSVDQCKSGDHAWLIMKTDKLPDGLERQVMLCGLCPAEMERTYDPWGCNCIGHCEGHATI